MSDRQFEVVLYGATGFTGKLVAEYLAEAHPDLTWAIAGRSQQKLDEVRQSINQPELPTIIADSADPASLTAMAQQATALISTVLALDGAGAAKAGELGAPLLWGGEREREGGSER